MNTTLSRPMKFDFLMLAAGAASALIAAGVLTNSFPNLGISDRTVLIALVVAGMTMCARGPLGKIAVYGWANPRHLFGYIIGALILAIAAARFFNLTWPFPSDRDAMQVILVVMLVKILVAATYPRLA